MAARRKQFTIGSLMVLIAILAVFLAYPALFAGMLIPAAFLAFPFLFLAFLAFPLVMIEWLDQLDVWFENRKRDHPSVRDEPVPADRFYQHPLPSKVRERDH